MERRRMLSVRPAAELRRPIRKRFFALAAGALVVISSTVSAATIDEAKTLFYAGKYAECAETAGTEIERGNWLEEWRTLKLESELTLGQYPQALKTAAEALNTHPASLPIQLLARTAYLYNGQQAQADQALAQIERLVVAAPRRYSAPADRVALGRFLLVRGADPRQVLELMYDPVRKDSPKFVDAYFATAELALDKYDNALAAQTLRAAPEDARKDPQYHLLLARAYLPDDPAHAEESVNAALEINPRHIETLLLRIDRLIDAEQYTFADRELKKVFDVNPNHPLAWAYKTVTAHLAGDMAGERQAHQWALSHWAANPEVDHTIGEKLSQKYRFAEGAAYQRKALVLNDKYRPAKLQLSQDLLRLGEETEGWKLADEVLNEDKYNVVAFNLATLRDEISKFRTLREDGLVVRMAAHEADLYGDRVLDLLKRARATLCKKYEFELNEPITIEIFPKQQDFAVRTFGLPGADGFLGVCFGRVITANSPASQGEHPSNWEAVLWHEFCHVVTLHKTHNKMPRWLSEGISVYEEKQANQGWGQAMSPQYREMILSDEMPPVSQLSSAFLSPKSPLHLQFAYFESALVVEFIVDRFGIDALKKVLTELGEGMEINEALVRYTVPLGELDGQFQTYARERANKLASDGTWEDVDLPASADSAALAKWLEDHPKNVRAMRRLARRLISEKKFAEAIEQSKKLLQLYPDDAEPENAYAMIAVANHELGDIGAERSALEELAKRDGDVVDAHMRLIEIGEETKDWQCVADNARRLLAVNPLIIAPHRSMARAAEELGLRDEAIRSYRALLSFDTADPANANFRLATLLREAGKLDEAKRHVLMALDEAPRYREAHRLLLELTSNDDKSAKKTPDNGEAASAAGQVDPNKEGEKREAVK